KHEHAEEIEQLEMSGRQLARGQVGHLRKAKEFQFLACLPTCFGDREAAAEAADHDTLDAGEIENRGGTLEGANQPGPRPLGGSKPREIASGETHAARTGRI